MRFDDIDLLLVDIVLAVIRMVRKDNNQRGRVLSLEFKSHEPEGKHDFWISGEELLDDGRILSISGQIRCIQGKDRLWKDSYIAGNVYLQDVGKCPFKEKFESDKGLKVIVSKDTGHAMGYNYTKIGEFEI